MLVYVQVPGGRVHGKSFPMILYTATPGVKVYIEALFAPSLTGCNQPELAAE